MKNKVTGIILAGGKASRMNGIDKGLLSVNGKTLIETIIQELKEVSTDILIIANNKKYDFLNYKIFNDVIKDVGPVGGIYTGLVNSKTNDNIIVACDLPFISSKVFNKLLKFKNSFDAVIPEINNNLQPLSSYYNKSCIGIFLSCINNNEYKIKNIIKLINTKILKFNKNEHRFFTNINTFEELKKIKMILK